MASVAELVRRGVRDQLPEPPWRLVRYHRSTGPTVERDVDPDDGVTEGTRRITCWVRFVAFCVPLDRVSNDAHFHQTRS